MLGTVVNFLVGALADFFSFLLVVRFIMQWARVSFAGPLGEFVLILTNGIVRPLRKLVPGFLGLDWASLLPAWLIQAAAVLVGLLFSPYPLADGVPLALLLGLVGLLKIGVWVLIVALIAQAIISWVNPYSPFGPTLNQLTRPLLRPIQRVLPPVGGRIDLSPLVVILLLQVVLMLIDALQRGLLLR